MKGSYEGLSSGHTVVNRQRAFGMRTGLEGHVIPGGRSYGCRAYIWSGLEGCSV
jgi:hypothetical protein